MPELGVSTTGQLQNHILIKQAYMRRETWEMHTKSSQPEPEGRPRAMTKCKCWGGGGGTSRTDLEQNTRYTRWAESKERADSCGYTNRTSRSTKDGENLTESTASLSGKTPLRPVWYADHTNSKITVLDGRQVITRSAQFLTTFCYCTSYCLLCLGVSQWQCSSYFKGYAWNLSVERWITFCYNDDIV
jgi:hypothetical protein